MNTRTRNPLRRRYLRELWGQFGKYAVIFVLLVFTIGLISGFLVADGSMIIAYKESFEKYNIEVLAIRPGYIALPGYDYGFIGGCSGLLKKNLLVFNGNISLHPDSDSILSFCKNHGTDVYSLSKGVLTDIGTITPLG